ncbi:MAG: ABC transporter substrate-binding protein [Pseudomonadota bacterium]|nr:ABC transporter substrate-binding protein [Pseudomonadota bacterium]
MTRRHPSLRSGLWLAFAGAALMLGACRKSESDAFDVAVIGTAPFTLGDPLLTRASEAQAVLRLNLAQGLVRFGSDGQVEPGLAERWNVSDDGLSYIFRLAAGEWPDGRKIMARDVARLLKRQFAATRGSATREALGAVEDVVAMTDRVIEIRLASPRPNLLELLAQPEFALIREGLGSGPFALVAPAKDAAEEATDRTVLKLTRRPPGVDGDPGEREDMTLRVVSAATAITSFANGDLDLVLGGSLNDLPLVQRASLPRGALHFDPASGLFGLVPTRAEGPLSEPDVRRLLSQAIDRNALVAALAVPGLAPRSTLLQAGLDVLPDPVQPAWVAAPIAGRRARLQVEAERLFGDTERPRLSVALPEGPGGDLLFKRLFADWGAIGIGVERVGPDDDADLKWIDAVAPSSSPAWFLRQFRCALTAICSAEADALLDQARAAPDAAQRGLLLGQAAALMDEATLFIALAAPVRWSLVGSRAAGYQDNRSARHPLAAIMQRATRGF